jgi:PAS domain S-box-containing protein
VNIFEADTMRPDCVVPSSEASSFDEALRNGGEMGQRMLAFDWSAHPLGPPADWPKSLQITIRIMLGSRYAMWMGWGPEFYFFCNDAYLPTLGIKENWALGASARKVWEEIWPDVGPRAESVVRNGQATWDEGLLLFLERSGSPEETYHTFSYSPIPDDSGAVGGMLCVVTEETERLIGERRLAALRDLAADISKTNTEAEVASAVERQLAAHPKDTPFALLYLFDSAAGQAVRAGAHGIDSGSTVAPAVIDLADPAPFWPASQALESARLLTVNVAGRHVPSGPWSKPPVQAAIVPIAQQGQEKAAGFLVAGINPFRPFDTAYKGFFALLAGQIAAGIANARVYESERQRAEALAEIDRAKTTFFSNVSHELRTPLTLMLGPLEDILNKPGVGDGDEQRDLASIAHRNGLRLLKLVNTLLDFSRLEAGRVRASYQALDLAALTTELASTFRSAIEKAGLRLKVECKPLPEPVYVDPEMWEKIVLNLLSNAYKFTLQGEITVSLRAVDESILLTVSDTGTGIPKEAKPHLFERFYRVQDARGRTHEGTGIGLALVQELARLHGGACSVESETGKGSAFTVSIRRGTAHLPKDLIHREPVPAPSPIGAKAFVEEALRWSSGDSDSLAQSDAFKNELAPLPVSPAGPLLKVLIVDDNSDMRDYVARLLSSRYDVVSFADGEAALAAVQRDPPDLVLSDVMMPRLDGFGLLKAIRAQPGISMVPVILLSARAGQEAQLDGRDAGADDYLIKPFSARELLARVASQLNLKRSREEAAVSEKAQRLQAESALLSMKRAQEALRQSEQRFRLLVEQASDGIVVADGQGVFTDVNSAACLMLGYAREELLKLAISAVFTPGDGDRLVAEVARLQTGETVRDEWTFLRKDGSTFVGELSCKRLPGGDLQGIVRDVTERKRVEEALRDSRAELEEHARSLEARVAERTASLREAITQMEEFSYSVSHDLRAPVRAMQGYAWALSEDQNNQLDANGRAYLERIIRAGARMDRLINDTLTYSRLARSQISLGPVSLDALVREVIQSYPEMQPPRAEITIASPLHRLIGHELSISQAISNLLANAVKFVRPDTIPRINLWTEKRDGQVRLWVADNGIGIRPEHQHRLFGMFERIHPESKYEGTGIGLAIVRKAVEKMGGRVGLESDGATGSKFWIQLPAAARET